MKGNEFLNKLEGLDADLIEQAADNERRTSVGKKMIFRIAAAAAAILLVVGGTVLLWPKDAPQSTGDTDGTQGTVSTPALVQGGVYIPPIELPESEDGVSMAMIGLVVYKGRIYTQAGFLSQCDDETISRYVGEHLGTATGTIDEWSEQSEYEKEFASNIAGEVYTVNGYDPSFRICVKWTNDEGVCIEFFENLNGITLSRGEDLFGDRLHLAEGYVSVEYQPHEDWDWGTGNFLPLDLPRETVDALLADVYNAEFRPLGQEDSDVYKLPQAHLWFHMTDGTTVGLRLFEGGMCQYASNDFSSFGAVILPISGEAFDAVMAACGL